MRQARIEVKVTGVASSNPEQVAASTLLRAAVVRHLAEIGFSGEAILHALERVAGSIELQGIHYRGAPHGVVPPVINLVAQLGDISTCWKWRLRLPEGTDAQQALEDLLKIHPSTIADPDTFRDFEAFERMLDKGRAYEQARTRMSESAEDLENLRIKRQALVTEISTIDRDMAAKEAEIAKQQAILGDLDARRAAEMLRQ